MKLGKKCSAGAETQKGVGKGIKKKLWLQLFLVNGLGFEKGSGSDLGGIGVGFERGSGSDLGGEAGMIS